jgi:hypothetical protein
MPFVNLPDAKESRWGDSLTAEKMKQCVWLRPEAVAFIEFLEWTGGDRLRHSQFVGLRDDKDLRMVVKEPGGRLLAHNLIDSVVPRVYLNMELGVAPLHFSQNLASNTDHQFDSELIW